VVTRELICIGSRHESIDLSALERHASLAQIGAADGTSEEDNYEASAILDRPVACSDRRGGCDLDFSSFDGISYPLG
jgi:hypothetical protein